VVTLLNYLYFFKLVPLDLHLLLHLNIRHHYHYSRYLSASLPFIFTAPSLHVLSLRLNASPLNPTPNPK